MLGEFPGSFRFNDTVCLIKNHTYFRTHKVANAGFAIQPLAQLPVSAMAPPLKAPSPRLNPKPATPIQPPLGRSRSRNNSPTTDAPALITRETTGRSPLHEAATLRSGTPTQPENASNDPTSRISTRSTVKRSPAVAEVTPVARGKRMRQPSPDKFLATQVGQDLSVEGVVVDMEVETEDEGTGDLTGEVVRGDEEVEEEEEEVDTTLELGDVVSDESDDENVVEDTTIEMEDGGVGDTEEVVEDTTVEDVEEAEPEDPAIAIKSPENRNKRRKVILEPEPEVSLELTKEPAADVETPRPKRKQQTTGKRPAPPQIPEDEEDTEDEVEAIEEVPESELELEAEPPELGVLEEGQNSHPNPRRISAKLHTTTQSKPKPKPHRRTQRQENSEPSATFAITVHRLNKSGNFVLPPGSQRPGFNPIDVISQVSMDCIDKSFPKLKSSTERKAVENFKEELSLRFLELV